MLDDETCGWYTLRDGTLAVWEGVCSLKFEGVIHLFKIRNGNLLSIRLQSNAVVKQVCSDGYWDCAEVTGMFKNSKSTFYYHADNTRNAGLMLQRLIELTSASIQSLNIRLDPDPLRLQNHEQISQRISAWSELGKEYCNEYQLILDSNMPL